MFWIFVLASPSQGNTRCREVTNKAASGITVLQLNYAGSPLKCITNMNQFLRDQKIVLKLFKWSFTAISSWWSLGFAVNIEYILFNLTQVLFWPASIKLSFSCEVCLCHVILHKMCQKTGSSITHLLSDWQYCYLINVMPFVVTSCAHLSLDTSPQIESPSPCIPPLHQPQLPPPPTPPTPSPQHLQHQQGAPALIPRKKTRIHRSSSDPVLMDLTAKGLPFWPVCNDSKFENWYSSVRWDNHVRFMLNRNVVASSMIYDNEWC